MRRFVQPSFFVCFVLCSTSPSLYSQEKSTQSESNESRYLVPPQQQERSSYDSLTEERGTPKLLKDLREARLKKNAEKGAEKEGETAPQTESEGPIINFNNVSITEVLKYVSRLTGKNFLYDPQELQFTITMISDHPCPLEEVLAMVIQNLRIHGFSVMEEGGSFIVHTNTTVRSAEGLYNKEKGISGPQIATKVFTLQNITADSCSSLIRTMVSDGAIVESVGNTNVIVSDFSENLRRISEIIKKLDSQSNGLEIGQYVAVFESPNMLAAMCERILAPMAADNPLIFVPHSSSNSVFIVSTPFLIEKSLSLMQSIDLNQRRSGVLSDEQMKFDPEAIERMRKEKEKGKEADIIDAATGQPVSKLSSEQIRQRLLDQGFSEDQINSFSPDAAREVFKQTTRSQQYVESDLPIGSVESTQFLIYKLQYRKNTDVVNALKSIAASLGGGPVHEAQQGPTGRRTDLSQSDLIITLESLQSIDDNNTIVFTGTKATLQKIKDLISQIDLPVRQVFFEVLVLDTTLNNALLFGTEWAGEIERTNLGANVGFRNDERGIGTITGFGRAFDAITQTTPNPLTPPPSPPGFSAGYFARKIKFLGKGFRSTGALIRALQGTQETHIVMNPKIVAEHNVPAEVFVGSQVPIKGQSIANSTTTPGSSLVTTNYNTQEVGITLKITPLISAHETVTLIIEQKVSTVSAAQVAVQGESNAPPATINEARTVTRVHLPSDHFLVMSGMMLDQVSITNTRIPCLGGLPIIGALFGDNNKQFQKRNLMMFIRPVIVDTAEDIDEITHNQELLLKQKSQVQEGRFREYDDIITFLNLD